MKTVRFSPTLRWLPFALALLSACSLFTRENVRTALDIAKVVCIVANAESDDQTVKSICNILDAEDEAFRRVLREQRVAARRFAASKAACAPDGGTDAGTWSH